MQLPTHGLSSNIFERLSDRPHLESLNRFLQELLQREGDRIAFVVLFGSMARGDWGRGSDYDVLVGLTQDDPRRVLDRLQQFDIYSDGWVEPLSYGPTDLQKMFTSFNLILLAALRDGLVLYDSGLWHDYVERYERLLDTGALVPLERAWRIVREKV